MSKYFNWILQLLKKFSYIQKKSSFLKRGVLYLAKVSFFLQVAIVCLLSSTIVFAIDVEQLPSGAQMNLSLGRQAVRQALAMYTEHSPSQPLWRDAVSYGHKAYEIAPNNPEVLRFLAETYTIIGWGSNAWDMWMVYIAANGVVDQSAQGQITQMGTNLGYGAYQSGDLEKALHFHQKVLELDPNNPGAISWTEYLASQLQQPVTPQLSASPTPSTSDDYKIQTALKLLPLAAANSGERAYVEAQLTDNNNQPIAEATLTLFIDNEQVRRGRTDAAGNVSIYAGRDLEVGTHDVKIIFNGAREYSGTGVAGTLTVNPKVETESEARSGTEERPKIKAQLELLSLQAPTMGERAYVEAKLVDNNNKPIAEATLTLFIDGQQVRRGGTDAAGNTSMYAGKDLEVGRYDVKVVFNGTREYSEAEVTGTLTIKPRPKAGLQLLPLDTFTLGEEVYVEAQLRGHDNQPVSQAALDLFINDERVQQGSTNATGEVSIFAGGLDAGTHSVKVVFKGDKRYPEAEVAGTLTIEPSTLIIETVPTLPNIGFSLAGEEFYSNEEGFAKIEVTKLGIQELKLLPLPKIEAETEVIKLGTQELKLLPLSKTQSVRIEFERWKDVYGHDRELDIRGDMELQAGFALHRPVKLTIVNLKGEPVDLNRVESLEFKNTLGNTIILDKETLEVEKISENELLHEFQANRVARLRNGLEVSPVQHSLIGVIIDGSNTVNKFQQRFFAYEGVDLEGTQDKLAVSNEGNNNLPLNSQIDSEQVHTWDITLLLYGARIGAKDAFFGFSVGKSVDLIYPNNRVEKISFDQNNEVFVDNLARGLYKVQVNGASGIAPVTPLAVSKFQQIDLKVLSTLDIALAFLSGLTLALGLLFYGRRKIPKLLFGATARGLNHLGSVLVFPYRLYRKNRELANFIRRLDNVYKEFPFLAKINSPENASLAHKLYYLDKQREIFTSLPVSERKELREALQEVEYSLKALKEDSKTTTKVAKKLIKTKVVDDILNLG